MMKTLTMGFAVALLALTAQAEQHSTMSLIATGSVSAEPDEGYITAGVTTIAAKSASAVRQNSAKMKGLFKILGSYGVARKDFKTVQFTVAENNKEVPHPTLPNRTKMVRDGFRVTNRVRVTVCDLDSFGGVLDALAANGANSIESIRFGNSNSEELRQKARVEACKAVREKAKVMCRGLGITLLRVERVAEQRQRNYELYDESSFRASAKSNVPVSGGTLSYSVSVSVTWEVADTDDFTLPLPEFMPIKPFPRKTLPKTPLPRTPGYTPPIEGRETKGGN